MRQDIWYTATWARLLCVTALTALAGTLAEPADAQIRLGSLATISGSARLRYEGWNWFDPGALPANDNHRYGFFAQQSHLVLKADPAPSLGFLVDVENVMLLGLPDDANAAAPFGDLGLGATYFAPHEETNDTRTFLHQGFLALRSPGHPATYLRVGRFEYNDGLEVMTGEPTLDWLKRTRLAARLVGTFAFSNVARSFDGLTAAVDQPRFNLTGLATRPRQGGFQLEGMKEISAIDLAALTLTLKPGVLGAAAEGRLFYMYYHDDRSPADGVVKVDNRAAAARAADFASIGMSQVGGHFIQTLPVGRGVADLLAWGVYQRGHWGLLQHRAWAGAAELGYQFSTTPWRPWARVGYNRTSGDGDPADSSHGTFFQTLTTARPYAQFPFFNMMNNEDLFAQLIVRPVAGRLSLRCDLHRLRLSNRNDLWYVGSGATQRTGVFGFGGRPSGDSRDLATLADLAVTWDPSPHVSLYGYYGHAFGGEVIDKIYQRTTGEFAYLETTLRF